MKNMIKPLTSLRFVFALFVFFSHTGSYLHTDKAYRSFYERYLYEGYLGVSFFFILSGFVLAYSYKEKFVRKEITKKDFWIARVARVYPLHLITFPLSIPLSLGFLLKAKTSTIIAVSIAHLFMLQSYMPYRVFYFDFNGVAWSISDEMFFYLLFPFLVSIFYISRQKKLIIPYVMLLGVVLILCPKDLYYSLIYISPFFRLIDFIWGMLLFGLYTKLKDQKWSGLKATLIEISSILLFILFYINHNQIDQLYRYSVYYWLPMLNVIVVFSLNKGWISRILSNRIFVLLGEISFSFYMIHALTLGYLKLIIGEDGIQHHILLFILSSFLTTMVFSILSFFYVERPLNKLIKRRLGSNFPAAPA
ncbi:acyltransferase [Pedobacter sp. L105]|uniref:acyltransferase family protein n=1 Tax=Pedobacter sp. L105 TaxID=1641871 RepID=UPI00131AE871|nr:acyltransferase [Pedobacter sp. L105]